MHVLESRTWHLRIILHCTGLNLYSVTLIAAIATTPIVVLLFQLNLLHLILMRHVLVIVTSYVTIPSKARFLIKVTSTEFFGAVVDSALYLNYMIQDLATKL